MSETFPVDYDAEAIHVDGMWLCRDDLAAKIRSLLDEGEYRISRLSAALEQLEVALGRARVLAVRVAPGLAEAVEKEAGRRGCSSSSILREAISHYLQARPATNGAEPSEGVDERWFEG